MRVKTSPISGTDLKVYHFGDHRVISPCIFGHEIAGKNPHIAKIKLS